MVKRESATIASLQLTTSQATFGFIRIVLMVKLPYNLCPFICLHSSNPCHHLLLFKLRDYNFSIVPDFWLESATMAKKIKNPMTNPPQNISDSSCDDDGAPIYTPPETEPNDGPSSSTHSLDLSHISEVIQGIQNVRLATDKSDDSAQEPIKDISAKPKKGRRSKAKRSVPADIAVDNVTHTLSTLVVADGGTDDLEQKRQKSKLAEEKAKKETDAEISNGKSKSKILKDAGYHGMKHFMDSYGLGLHDYEDIATANEMIKRMGNKAGVSSSNDHTGPIEEKYPESEEGVGEKEISNYEWLKLSKWHDMKHFMIAHGFKWGEDQASDRKSKQLHVSKKEEVEKVEDSSAKLKTGKTKKKDVVGLWQGYFGNETELENWQRLCVDVGMEEVPTSITQCRKALGKVWVNIFDFLDAKAEGKPVKRYKSERKLATYTMNSGKIYPKEKAKQGGPVRALLAHSGILGDDDLWTYGSDIREFDFTMEIVTNIWHGFRLWIAARTSTYKHIQAISTYSPDALVWHSYYDVLFLLLSRLLHISFLSSTLLSVLYHSYIVDMHYRITASCNSMHQATDISKDQSTLNIPKKIAPTTHLSIKENTIVNLIPLPIPPPPRTFPHPKHQIKKISNFNPPSYSPSPHTLQSPKN
ncbi:hypothetical protein EYC80_004706 [Monilinia laxa]|uniref:Uncharacterized protein n=1 Tax=Monilinia laxa TaxID=61186 RepID=A0A5N6KHK5_MONLA|nr:hypothetical protein EYC80_004706 [Monilinia laxa]